MPLPSQRNKANVGICVRVRPILSFDKSADIGVVTKCNEKSAKLTLVDPRHKGTDREYDFDMNTLHIHCAAGIYRMLARSKLITEAGRVFDNDLRLKRRIRESEWASGTSSGTISYAARSDVVRRQFRYCKPPVSIF